MAAVGQLVRCQLVRCERLYFCTSTSKASKLSTCADARDAAGVYQFHRVVRYCVCNVVQSFACPDLLQQFVAR
jgi:hypothetical protein